MSRSTAAILGGVLGGAVTAAEWIVLSYLVEGPLSRGALISAALTGIGVAVLYPILVL